MFWIIKRKLDLGLGLFPALRLGMVAAALIAVQGYRGPNESGRHPQEVLREFANALSGRKDGETGGRGFMLTGDGRFRGVNAYVVKPVDFAQSIDAVKQVEVF
ncbi:MAG: hypothetical protein PSU94_06425 [Lacunisphaera sp.]|nr:hypothetical protein [Lacunisphaera sp.]